MNDSLRPYVEYRDSGITWLGAIPTHWEVAPLRRRYDVQLGKMLDAKRISGSHLVPYLRNIDVQWDKVNTDGLPAMDITVDEYERYTVRPGDMLVCEGGEVGRAAFWKGQLPLCGFQKALHRVRPLDPAQSAPRYLFYIMYLAAKLGVFQSDGNENTIAHLTLEKLRAHRLPFPPSAEQEAIAHFLDHHDRSFARFIRAKRRLIDLLNEQKQAIIHRAVTRGLDPDVRLKQSGVEWLGEVPEHWRIVKLSRLSRVLNGTTPSRTRACLQS